MLSQQELLGLVHRLLSPRFQTVAVSSVVVEPSTGVSSCLEGQALCLGSSTRTQPQSWFNPRQPLPSPLSSPSEQPAWSPSGMPSSSWKQQSSPEKPVSCTVSSLQQSCKIKTSSTLRYRLLYQSSNFHQNLKSHHLFVSSSHLFSTERLYRLFTIVANWATMIIVFSYRATIILFSTRVITVLILHWQSSKR